MLFACQASEQLLVAAARKITALFVAAIVPFAASVDLVDRCTRSRTAGAAPISIQTRQLISTALFIEQ